MIYKASLDKLSKGISAGIAGLFLLIGILLPVVMGTAGDPLTGIISPVFLALLYFFVWLFHTTAYEITGDAIVVKKVAGSVQIRRSDIEEIRTIEKDELKGTLRTFGVGGLFGYYGRFYNTKLGKMTWYMTRMDNAVMLRMNSGTIYLLSPDAREDFVNQLRG